MGIIKIIWVLSLLGFLVVSLFVYTTLPTNVTIISDANGYPTLFLAKANFFYATLALLVFFNVAILILGQAIQFLPSYWLPVPQRAFWFQKENRVRLYRRFAHWTKGLGFCANVFIIIAVVEIQAVNGQEMTLNLSFLYAVALGTLAIWAVLYYPVFGIWIKKLE